MAIMMDNKPTEYKGEALVWEKLYSLLPNDVVIYNHREVVDDREFDFALLIKDVGILVLEVKGWQALKYMVHLRNRREDIDLIGLTSLMINLELVPLYYQWCAIHLFQKKNIRT